MADRFHRIRLVLFLHESRFDAYQRRKSGISSTTSIVGQITVNLLGVIAIHGATSRRKLIIDAARTSWFIYSSGRCTQSLYYPSRCITLWKGLEYNDDDGRPAFVHVLKNSWNSFLCTVEDYEIGEIDCCRFSTAEEYVSATIDFESMSKLIEFWRVIVNDFVGKGRNNADVRMEAGCTHAQRTIQLDRIGGYY